jgi:Fic family protein
MSRNVGTCTVRFDWLLPYKIRGSTMPGRPSRQQIYRRLDEAMAELRSKLGGLPSPTEAEAIWTTIWYEEAHNSTALEGNTLVLKQVERLLGEGVAVGNKRLREYMEVKGYADASRWVYEHAIAPGEWSDGKLVTLTELRHIHALAMSPAWDVEPHGHATQREYPGGFREHDIAPFPGGMKPPPWTEVPSAIRQWLTDISRLAGHPANIEAISDTHARFERIHPFLDGNGRTGRLVLNLVLVRLGYAPVIVFKRDRDRYLRALRSADAGDPGPLAELLARAVLDNLLRFILPAVAPPDHLVPLAALATRELSEGALRVAANRGRLQAQKGADGQWRSTRAWVDGYIASRHRRQR